jgi:hypothetical protein
MRRSRAAGAAARAGHRRWLATRSAGLRHRAIAEAANNLKGVTPMSTTLTINPENWYYVK